MSSDRFDELARNLAEPMSRRRALRLAAGAFVAGTLPWLRPATVAASDLQDCAGRNELCAAGHTNCGHSTAGQTGPCCCYCCEHAEDCGGDGGFCCPPAQRCADTCCLQNQTCQNGKCVSCPLEQECGDTCCPEGQTCDNGVCVPCSSELQCGSKCCREGQVCRNPSTGLCCVKTWHVCTAGLAGAKRCCAPGDECCFDHKTGTVACCNKPSQFCNSKGTCDCHKGERCRSDCCTNKEHCSKGKCCPKGETNCHGKCCPERKCCDDVCCAKHQVCTGAGQFRYCKG